jgi:hypothetical protein
MGTLSIVGIAFAALCIGLTVRIMNRRERWAKWSLVGALIGPPLLYVGGYALMVRPFPFISVHGESSTPGPHTYLRSAIYEGNLPLVGWMWTDADCQLFFAPIHNLDLKIRPKTWYVELQFDPLPGWRNDE